MPEVLTPPDLRNEIADFYARQVQAMDNGRFEEFAETFLEDCAFTPVKHQSTAYGRASIVEKLNNFATTVFGTGQQRRHIMTMSVIDLVDDDTYNVTSYAIVTNTTVGQGPALHWAGDIVDQLVREDGNLKVRSRAVRSDSIE